MKHVRIELRSTDAKHLFCISCGCANPHPEYEVVNGGEAQTGLHKSCIDTVHAKRGANRDES